MTKAQIQKIKDQLNKKWQDGSIHADDYFDTAALLDRDPDRGLQEAERILGKDLLPATKKKAAGKGMTQAEFSALVNDAQQMYDDGDVTRDELQGILDELKKLNDHQISKDKAEKVMQALQDGLPADFAEKHAGVDLTAKPKKTTRAPKQEPGTDPGTMAADAAVSKLEQDIKDVYLQAAREMQAKLNQVVKENREKLNQLYADKAAGLITQADIDRWVDSQNHRTKRMEEKLDQIAGVMTDANRKALGMINGATLGVFAENATFQNYQLARNTGLGLMFSVYDENAVKRLIKEDPELLPRKVVNGRKDKAWNQRIISNALKQAIIQGESIPTLARRIAAATAGSNNDAMVRYARTAMTSAQNAGRQEMLNQAKGMGIKCKKVWLATLDSRTRDVHAKLDGQKVDIDKPFKSDLGDIMYPGDMGSSGSVPANLYNCRCTLTYEYEGFPNAPEEDLRRDNETGELIKNMTYTEWKKQNAPAAEQAKPAAESKLQRKTNKAANPVSVLSTETRDALEEYTMGEEFHLDQDQFDEVTAAMQGTTKTLYRVESSDRTAEQEDLQVGDVFDFSQYVFESKDEDNGALRSFTRSDDALPDLLGQTDDAVIYRTHGTVDQLPVDSLSQYDQKESLAYANGWKVAGFDTMEIDGKIYRVIDIEQVKEKVGQDGTITDHDTLMKKINALESAGTGDEAEKKNLLPMAAKEIRETADQMFMDMPERERKERGKLTTLNISQLKTEQAEIFTDRLEDIAEQFGSRAISGDPEKNKYGDGITVALYKGEYIVLDGNNRTNLAILKGQETLDVMVVDLDAKLAEQKKTTIVQGKDITDTWHRRPDDFAFEINDVINAQGFDGRPRIVDADEFEKAVKESGFVAQRNYSAPDKETLDLYRQQLYEGEWYVDCSTGGAQYGQGMYCAADYTGTITPGMKEEMDHYAELGTERALVERLRGIEKNATYDEIKENRYGGNVKEEVFDIWKKTKASGTTIYKAKAEGIITQEEYEIWSRATVDYSPNAKDDPYFGNWRDINMAVDDMREKERESFIGHNYTETFTLTPGAKIITSRDLDEELTKYKAVAASKAKAEVIDKYSGKGDDFTICMKREAGDETISFDRAMESYKKMDDREKTEFRQAIKEMNEAGQKKETEMASMDPGVYAAMAGYDAINAEGHGQSGSYTVILNRTKCIFKRDAQ